MSIARVVHNKSIYSLLFGGGKPSNRSIRKKVNALKPGQSYSYSFRGNSITTLSFKDVSTKTIMVNNKITVTYTKTK